MHNFIFDKIAQTKTKEYNYVFSSIIPLSNKSLAIREFLP